MRNKYTIKCNLFFPLKYHDLRVHWCSWPIMA